MHIVLTDQQLYISSSNASCMKSTWNIWYKTTDSPTVMDFIFWNDDLNLHRDVWHIFQYLYITNLWGVRLVKPYQLEVRFYCGKLEYVPLYDQTFYKQLYFICKMEYTKGVTTMSPFTFGSTGVIDLVKLWTLTGKHFWTNWRCCNLEWA
jgi:hypothetical protein